MTRVLRKVARSIRHLPGLKNLDGLWDRLRSPYETILNRGGEGVEVDIGGAARVRMPAAYANKPWEKYETETMKVFAEWCRQHPGCRILDVGSSVGIFTLAGLSLHPENEVIAFDSDHASLNVLQEFCRLASGKRLTLVQGLISSSGCGWGIKKAAETTRQESDAMPKARSNSSTRYVCLNDADAERLRQHTLDDLLQSWERDSRPVLLKTDVEGAEQLVLEGGRRWIQNVRPTMLLEVHPAFLPRFGHSTDTLRRWLQEAGYSHQLIGIDYSEHWICEPNPRPSSKKS